MKFNETLKILEDNIFKPASPEEATERQQEYALIHINNILKEHGHQNPNGSWDVDGDVFIYNLGLTEIPVKFNKVNGHFSCSENKLKSLKGAPKEVGGSFYCSDNNLTSLTGAPKEVGGSFDCSHNNLTSLTGAPKEVGGDFDCSYNKVKFTKNDVKAHSIVNKFIYII